MPGRFHYRPVDPGIAEFGRGIARGIGGATDQYARAKQRERDDPMRELLEARALAEARQAGIRPGNAPWRPTIEIEPPAGPDFGAAEQPGIGLQPRRPAPGGGLGVQPEGWRFDTPFGTPNVGLPGARAPEPAPPEARGGVGPGLRLVPDAGWVAPQMEEGPIQRDYSRFEADPAFEQLNEGFYMATPEARARQEQIAEREAQEERAELLRQYNPGNIPAELAVKLGIEPSYFAQFDEPEPATGRWYDGKGINPDTGEPEQFLYNRDTGEQKWLGSAPVDDRGGASRRPTATSLSDGARRVIDMISDVRGWRFDPRSETREEFRRAQQERIAGIIEDYDLTLEQAQHVWRTGEWPEDAEMPTEPEEVAEGFGMGPGAQSFEDLIYGRWGIPFLDREDRSARGEHAPPLSEDEIEEARELVSRIADDAGKRAKLEEIGFPDEQVDQILGEGVDRSGMVDELIGTNR